MSMVSYNGISIPYAMTRVHQIGPVMDPSGSDELFLRVRLEAEGLVDYDQDNPIMSGLTGGSAERVLKTIRHMLCQPRKPLYYDTEIGPGGTPTANSLINLPTGRDDANGPIPDDAAIDVQFTSPGCYMVKFAVETYIRECNPYSSSAGRPPDQPLSIRWETAIDFTDQFQCLLTRTGTAIISSLSAISIDTIRRNWVTPRIPPGFARKQAHYQMSRDGLRCDFRFVDAQLQYAPPAPAVSLDIVQTEETRPTGVGMRDGVISVRCKGFLGTDPVRLMEIAAQVANYRLYAARPRTTGAGGLVIGATKFATEESIEDVSVTLVRTYRTRMREITRTTTPGTILYPSSTVTSPYLPLNYGWVGYGTSRRTGYAPWASDSSTAPTGVIGVRPDGVGMARAVGFFAALLRDPCGTALSVTPNAAPSTPTTRELRGGPVPGGVFDSVLSATVSVMPGGGTARSSGYWSGFLTPSASTFGVSPAPTGTGTAAAMQAESTAAPTTQALVTAVLAEYGSADGQTLLAEGITPLVADDLAAGVYDLWQCYNEYDVDQGNVVVPTCNPEADLVQIKHSADVFVFRKKWTATKVGSPPALPAEDQGDNLVLVRKYVGLPNVNVTANGNDIEYRIDGVYEYRALNQADAKLIADSPPFLAPTWAAKVYDWANSANPYQLSDDGRTAAYFPTTVQPPAGVYDFPANQYVNSLGTGASAASTLQGTPPQPGGSTSPGFAPGGSTGGGTTMFDTGVDSSSTGTTPGTPVFGGASTSAGFLGTGGAAAVVPSPPPQPQPDEEDS